MTKKPFKKEDYELGRMTFRPPKKMQGVIEKLGEQENRSLNLQVQQLVQEALEARGVRWQDG